MKMIADGVEVSPDGFCYNDHMNFGQAARFAPDSLADFRMTIPRAEFIERFDTLYEALRTEMLDHYQEGREDFDESDGLFVLGFKPLAESFAKPEALAEVIEDFLVWNHSSSDSETPSCILDAYFGCIEWDGKKIINGIDAVRVDDEGVTLSGFFHRGKPVRVGT